MSDESNKSMKITKKYSYYQYEQIEEEYKAKRGSDTGKLKTSKRTERVQYYETVDVIVRYEKNWRSI